jgi:hypothetical protein
VNFSKPVYNSFSDSYSRLHPFDKVSTSSTCQFRASLYGQKTPRFPFDKLRASLCHAQEDKPIVRELYQRLLAKGWIAPWLDEEKLPKQD